MQRVAIRSRRLRNGKIEQAHKNMLGYEFPRNKIGI